MKLMCPECGYEGDEEDFIYRFCPSWPDKCKGCEVDTERVRCPDCDHTGPKQIRDPRDQWDTWEEWRGER